MSIHSASASTSDSTCPNATQLVRALQRHAGKVPKPLVHGSAYCVPLDSDSDAESESDADVFADGSPKDADSDTEGGISSRKLSRKGKERILTSWKVSEFAYRKVQRVGTSEEADLPTLARGLFTTQTRSAEGVGEEEHRIVVRGYDKFFNVDEMQWTKVSWLLHSFSARKMPACMRTTVNLTARLLPTHLFCSLHRLRPPLAVVRRSTLSALHQSTPRWRSTPLRPTCSRSRRTAASFSSLP